MRWPSPLVILAAIPLACTTTAATGVAPRACHSDAECPASERCTYAVQGSCDGIAYCGAGSGDAGCVPETACGCDGVTRPVCLIGGESPMPIAHLGSCAIGAAE